jgi:hypothetical protein
MQRRARVDVRKFAVIPARRLAEARPIESG